MQYYSTHFPREFFPQIYCEQFKRTLRSGIRTAATGVAGGKIHIYNLRAVKIARETADVMITIIRAMDSCKTYLEQCVLLWNWNSDALFEQIWLCECFYCWCSSVSSLKVPSVRKVAIEWRLKSNWDINRVGWCFRNCTLNLINQNCLCAMFWRLNGFILYNIPIDYKIFYIVLNYYYYSLVKIFHQER